MQSVFTNKTVIVTGTSTGIGRSTAIAFLDSGANVVLAARTETTLRALVDSLPASLRERTLIVPTDVAVFDDVKRLVDSTIQRFGQIDILINNAGFGMRATVEQTRLEDARRLMDVNFFGALQCIQAVLPHMKQAGHGQIVNVGSILSLVATPENSIYSASKFALRALSDALRIELKRDNIDVILIMPGYTDTPFFDNMIRHHGPPRTTSLRGQSPDKVARVILRACARRRHEVVLTLPAKLGAIVKRMAPRFLDWALSKRK